MKLEYPASERKAAHDGIHVSPEKSEVSSTMRLMGVPAVAGSAAHAARTCCARSLRRGAPG